VKRKTCDRASAETLRRMAVEPTRRGRPARLYSEHVVPIAFPDGNDLCTREGDSTYLN